MKKGTRPLRFQVPSKFKRLVQSTRYKKSPYTAQTAVRTPALHHRLVKLIAKKVRKECAVISSRKHNSYLRLSVAKLKSFSWESVESELKQHAPTLLSVLKATTQSSKGNSKIAGMAAAVLLKGRNKHLCLPQGVISTIMYAGHSSKMVSTGCSSLWVRGEPGKRLGFE